MIAATGLQLTRAVDLGCGTGLAGPGLRIARSRLVGVDLSPRMLAKAEERGCYDALIEVDMMTFLEQTSERFDLLFAADTLVYLGGLDDFFAAAARVAMPGGLLAFNVETTTLANWVLLPSGRFAHCVEALLASAAPWFTLRSSQPAFLRVEANQRVDGALVLLSSAASTEAEAIEAVDRTKRGRRPRLQMRPVGPAPLRPKQRHQHEVTPSPVRSDIGLAQHAVASEA